MAVSGCLEVGLKATLSLKKFSGLTVFVPVKSELNDALFVPVISTFLTMSFALPRFVTFNFLDFMETTLTFLKSRKDGST